MNELDADTIKNIAEDMAEKLPVFLTVKHRGKKYGVVHGGVPFTYKECGNDKNQEAFARIADSVELFDELYQLGQYFIAVRDHRGDNTYPETEFPEVK
ncbi:hypothetical protein, partial [Enterococcus faecalis]|uniref:hypothetical protein n=1 Tax=Enterococcus faecalis TaxID=1351 RepID=UPI003985EC80